jgi:hypothetical protein
MEQAYAGAEAEKKTNAEIRTALATTARATMAVRFRSAKDGW